MADVDSVTPLHVLLDEEEFDGMLGIPPMFVGDDGHALGSATTKNIIVKRDSHNVNPFNTF